MTWFISIAVALLCGVAGLLLAGLIANACVSWYHVSSREGGSGYMVIFLGAAGGIAGVIVGLIVARLIATQYGSGFVKETAGALGVVLLIAGISVVLCRMLADVAPTIDGRDLSLEVEFRFPNTCSSNQPPTSQGEWECTLASLSGHERRKTEQGKIHSQLGRFESGQWIVPTETYLFTERGRRNVMLARREDKEVVSFLLPLPSRPGPAHEKWSEWLPRQQANGQPWPADRMSCRFRVQKIPIPSPPQSEEDGNAVEDAKSRSPVGV